MAHINVEIPQHLIEIEVSKRVKKFEARLKELEEFDKTRAKLERKIQQLESELQRVGAVNAKIDREHRNCAVDQANVKKAERIIVRFKELAEEFKEEFGCDREHVDYY